MGELHLAEVYVVMGVFVCPTFVIGNLASAFRLSFARQGIDGQTQTEIRADMGG